MTRISQMVMPAPAFAGVKELIKRTIGSDWGEPTCRNRTNFMRGTGLPHKFTSKNDPVFVAEESNSVRSLPVDYLLILQYLLRHPEVGWLESLHLIR
jgi:hypothetical protein